MCLIYNERLQIVHTVFIVYVNRSGHQKNHMNQGNMLAKTTSALEVVGFVSNALISTTTKISSICDLQMSL